jgi:hypothetical protein
MKSSGISTATSEKVSEMMVKAISREPFSAASSGGAPASMWRADVLDDDDRVVDDEAGGDHQRHQRQVVDREAGEVHEAEGADERDGDGDAGNDGGGECFSGRQRWTASDQGDGEQQARPARRAPRARMVTVAVGEHRDVDRRRQRRLQLRQLPA